VPTLKELADDAFAVLAAESDDRAQRFVDGVRRPDLDLLRELYGHCRCDWFAGALHVMTGWQIVAAGSPGSAPVHLLVRDSAGRLVDVYGYVTVADLRERYGVADLEIFEPGDMHSGHDLAVEHVPSVAASMLYLELEPFVSLRTEVLDWVTSLPEASQIGAQSLAERRIPINGVPQESVV
jgi:hypothetical protein